MEVWQWKGILVGQLAAQHGKEPSFSFPKIKLSRTAIKGKFISMFVENLSIVNSHFSKMKIPGVPPGALWPKRKVFLPPKHLRALHRPPCPVGAGIKGAGLTTSMLCKCRAGEGTNHATSRPQQMHEQGEAWGLNCPPHPHYFIDFIRLYSIAVRFFISILTVSSPECVPPLQQSVWHVFTTLPPSSFPTLCLDNYPNLNYSQSSGVLGLYPCHFSSAHLPLLALLTSLSIGFVMPTSQLDPYDQTSLTWKLGC
ncbi:hypothetical protein Pst134EA_011225 [Puccinia striiformis f. sp. tritici]|uniref:hypothetical protein n=1 Tax=Puccinia striiformis f. sp. tritici TaxID=168172 RepID=UPI0020079501|nr:hypothetical protein Pst134EA_011225 [Puccinia striiformis f. sp. tritici]KAH9467586.1 hypothetical protein Pst134EA_011225 [Puccinia striiformis f. sp. tritici]